MTVLDGRYRCARIHPGSTRLVQFARGDRLVRARGSRGQVRGNIMVLLLSFWSRSARASKVSLCSSRFPLGVTSSKAMDGSAAGRPNIGSGIWDSWTGRISTGGSRFAGGKTVPGKMTLAPLATGVVSVKTPKGGANANPPEGAEAAEDGAEAPVVMFNPLKEDSTGSRLSS
jgi:hypothetical protein